MTERTQGYRKGLTPSWLKGDTLGLASQGLNNEAPRSQTWRIQSTSTTRRDVIERIGCVPYEILDVGASTVVL